jgi:hypothetical protein
MSVIPALRGGLGNQMSAVANSIIYGKMTNREVKLNVFDLETPHSREPDILKLWLLDLTADIGKESEYSNTLIGYLLNSKKTIPLSKSIRFYGNMSHHFMDYTDLDKVLHSHLNRKTIIDQSSEFPFLHVRKGDFESFGYSAALNLDLHAEYYPKAIKVFNDRGIYTFNVCSDDISWCKINLSRLYSLQTFIYNDVSALKTLKLMANCNGGITANSSLSWWGMVIGHHLDSSRVYCTPTHYMLSPWPLTPLISKNIVPPWAIGIAPNCGEKSVDYTYIIGIVVALFCIILSVKAIYKWK